MREAGGRFSSFKGGGLWRGACELWMFVSVELPDLMSKGTFEDAEYARFWRTNCQYTSWVLDAHGEACR